MLINIKHAKLQISIPIKESILLINIIDKFD